MACFGEDYESKFEARVYLDKIYNKDFVGVGLKEILRDIYEMFQNSGMKGGTLLDIGSGPTIHTALLGSRVYSEVTLSEFAGCNRKEILKWVNDDPDAFDWGVVLSLIAELERSDPKTIEARARKTLKEVIPVDLTQDNIFHPNIRGKYDCVISSLCVETSIKDLPSFRNVIQKIGTHVKDDGHLILIGLFGHNWYKFGQHSFHCLSLNQEELEKAVISAGFKICDMKVTPSSNQEFPGVEYDGYAKYSLDATKLAN